MKSKCKTFSTKIQGIKVKVFNNQIKSHPVNFWMSFSPNLSGNFSCVKDKWSLESIQKKKKTGNCYVLSVVDKKGYESWPPLVKGI